MQVEVTDADLKRANAWLDRPSDTAARRSERDRLAVRFARHRIAERERVVREIVAELRELHWTHRDAEPAKRLAGMIEAKFGGRD